MMSDDITLGEIRRNLLEIKSDLLSLRTEVRDRNHALTAQIQNTLGPVAVLTVRVENTEKDINEVYTRQRECEKGIERQDMRAAYVGGAVAVIITVGKIVLDLFK